MRHYREWEKLGKAKHAVTFHDGEKQHADGSAFYDMRLFRTKRERERFTRTLRENGYHSDTVTEHTR